MWHCYTIIWLLSIDVIGALEDKVQITYVLLKGLRRNVDYDV